MSNKILKDANNQLINIDSSNLSSFSSDVVHKGTQSRPSDEEIYGTKNIFGDIQLNEYNIESGDDITTYYPSIKFNASVGSITNSAGYVYLEGNFARVSLGGGIDVTAAITSAQSNEIHMRAPGESVPSDYWESGISFNTTDTKYNDSTSDYEFRKGYSKLPTDDGSTSSNYYTLATQEWSNSKKVSKTGDTMTGDLQLNVGSGYSLSPKLVFVNHGGNGYLYKDNDSLILNHVGSSSNYTLTFPTKTANIATTTKTVIVRNSGYSPQFTYASLDVEYYDEDNNANTIRLAEGESTTINCVAWCLKRVDTIATAEPVLGLYSGIAFAGTNSSIYRQIQSGSMYITVPITDWDGIVLPVTETSAFECYHAVARKAA